MVKSTNGDLMPDVIYNCGVQFVTVIGQYGGLDMSCQFNEIVI